MYVPFDLLATLWFVTLLVGITAFIAYLRGISAERRRNQSDDGQELEDSDDDDGTCGPILTGQRVSKGRRRTRMNDDE